MQFNSDSESKALLTGNEEENMDPLKLNAEAAGKEKAAEETKPEIKEGVENQYEDQSVRVTQSGCHDNVQREEEFDVKDLLSFAWQIARGMVSCSLLKSSGTFPVFPLCIDFYVVIINKLYKLFCKFL